jgi:putative DNA primase/helicase
MVGADMTLTSEQHRIYFEARLNGQQIAATDRDVSVRCPLHDDHQASMSLHVDRGVFNCHAGCGAGGVLEFEKRFSNCDAATAWANIASICGLKNQNLFRQQPEAVYQYTDEDGALLFEKLRFPGKKFTQRTKGANGAWTYKLDGVRKVLYRLPELVRASDAMICEGEKDADRVRALKLSGHPSAPSSRVAATTNFDGAGKWRPEYSPYFTGKHVVIFPDNDAPGKNHAKQVAASISLYALDVRIVELPGLGGHGDVSDYLDLHNAEDLLNEIRKAPRWKPEKGNLLVDAPEFLSTVSPEIDWLVDGLIQRGANGFICAPPKVGKSWLAVDLALSLALGLPWTGFDVRRPTKVALITREDNPALTRWRMDRLLTGKNRTTAGLEGRLYVNSREQSPAFRLDNVELFVPMIAELRAVQPEFAILDVFNILHGADENDNTEMRRILEELNRLQREVGCSIGVVHHFNKTAEGSLTQRLRGAGAIAGWAEWLIGIEAADEHVRKLLFELKAAQPPEPLYYRVSGEDFDNWKRIERTDWVPDKTAKRSRAADFIQ